VRFFFIFENIFLQTGGGGGGGDRQNSLRRLDRFTPKRYETGGDFRENVRTVTATFVRLICSAFFFGWPRRRTGVTGMIV